MMRGNLAGRKRSVRTALAGLLAGLVWTAIAVVPAQSAGLSTDATLSSLDVYVNSIDIGPGSFARTNFGPYKINSSDTSQSGGYVDAVANNANYQAIEISTDGYNWTDVLADDTFALGSVGTTTQLLVRVTAEDDAAPRKTYTVMIKRGTGTVGDPVTYSHGLSNLSCFDYDLGGTNTAGATAGFGAFSGSTYSYSNAGNPIPESSGGDGYLYCSGTAAAGSDATIEFATATGSPATFDTWITDSLPFDTSAADGLIAQGDQPQYFYIRVSTPDGFDAVYAFETFVETTGVGVTLGDLVLQKTGGANIPFDPSFDSTTYDYADATTNQTAVVVVTDRDDVNAKVQIRKGTDAWETVAYAGGYEEFTVTDLACGVNEIDVKVSGLDFMGDPDQQIYSVEVTSTSPNCGAPSPTPTPTPSPTLSSNANLSSLTCTTCVLAPTFSSSVTSYTSSVAQTVGSVTMTPVVAESHATVKVRVNAGAWQSVTSGTASGALLLNFGANTVDVQVTAEDNSVKTYSIVITRAGTGFLADLVLAKTDGTVKVIVPVFTPNTFAYTSGVGYKATAVTVKPSLLAGYTSAALSVSVNGGAFAALANGATSSALALNVGSNTITVKVVSGSTTQTYVLTVTRKAQPCIVPNVTGLKLSVAKARLTKAGCGFTVVKVANATVAAGRVIKQTPAKGVRRPHGFKVTLLVSLG